MQRITIRAMSVLAIASTALLMTATGAFASSISIEALGGPVPSNSWSQQFKLWLAPDAGTIAMRVVGTDTGGSAATFSSQTALTLNQAQTSDLSSWSTQDLNPAFSEDHYVLSGGPENGFLDFTLHFSGETDDWSFASPLTVEFAAFDTNQSLLGSTAIHWTNDGTWAIGFSSWNPGYEDVAAIMVPLPASVWMGLLGLIGVVTLARMRRVAV